MTLLPLLNIPMSWWQWIWPEFISWFLSEETNHMHNCICRIYVWRHLVLPVVYPSIWVLIKMGEKVHAEFLKMQIDMTKKLTYFEKFRLKMYQLKVAQVDVINSPIIFSVFLDKMFINELRTRTDLKTKVQIKFHPIRLFTIF